MAKKRPKVTTKALEKRENMMDDLVKMKQKFNARQDLRRAAKEAESRRNREIEIGSVEGQLSMLRPGVHHDVAKASLKNRLNLLQHLKK